MTEQVTSKKKMKLRGYLTILISTLVVFILSWILMGIAGGKYDTNWIRIWGAISAVVLIILMIQLISISVKMLITSIKRLLSFSKEDGLWKILTLVFGIGLTLFAGLVAIFSLVWIIKLLSDGFFKFGNGFDGWLYNLWASGQIYISKDGLFITSFVFILIWCAGGIGYEFLKKILGGNKAKKIEPEQKED